ncbi:hypothetical protein, partial [Neolewinella agarilytica]|uniref:hypothetical protein n=1 Tax=Neolewinella agarilytica TaxID=478744 RepID=UPI0023570897
MLRTRYKTNYSAAGSRFGRSLLEAAYATPGVRNAPRATGQSVLRTRYKTSHSAAGSRFGRSLLEAAYAT